MSILSLVVTRTAVIQILNIREKETFSPHDVMEGLIINKTFVGPGSRRTQHVDNQNEWRKHWIAKDKAEKQLKFPEYTCRKKEQ